MKQKERRIGDTGRCWSLESGGPSTETGPHLRAIQCPSMTVDGYARKDVRVRCSWKTQDCLFGPRLEQLYQYRQGRPTWAVGAPRIAPRAQVGAA